MQEARWDNAVEVCWKQVCKVLQPSKELSLSVFAILNDPLIFTFGKMGSQLHTT